LQDTDVTVTIAYFGEADGDKNNSFDFQITNGSVSQILVKSGQEEFLYDYPGSITADTGLNLREGGSQDASHLDFCLSASVPDSESPSVTITSPLQGAIISGTVIVTATVSDNVAVRSATASVNGVPLEPDTSTADPYDWSWNTTAVSSGSQTVTVTATDTSDNVTTSSVAVTVDNEPPTVTIDSPLPLTTVSGTVIVTATVSDNVAVDSVTASVDGVLLDPDTSTADPYDWTWDTAPLVDGPYTIILTATDSLGNETVTSTDVTVQTSVAFCVGIVGNDSPDPGGTVDPLNEGCNPTGVQNIQVPPDNLLNDCAAENGGVECSITEFLLTPDPALNTAHPTICEGPNVFADPRVNGAGFPVDIRELHVFTELGGNPDPGTFGGDALVYDEFTYGNPCFAVAFGTKNFPLTAGFDWPDNPATGLVIVRTQFAELIDGIGTLTQCFDPTQSLDLQEAGQAVIQDDFRSKMIEKNATAMTRECYNPIQMSTRDFSFSSFNMKEHGGIVFDSPTGPDEVLEFKFQRADAKFDALGLALDAAEQDLISPKFSDLTRLYNQARSQFNKLNIRSLDRALEDLGSLLLEVQNGTWNVTDENRPGDVQIRVENLIYRVKLLRSFLANS
jgi:hypothetical protein